MREKEGKKMRRFYFHVLSDINLCIVSKHIITMEKLITFS